MRRRGTIFQRALLASAIGALILQVKPAHAQATVPDKKDHEIELLKSEVEQLEERVDHLESLKGSVSRIDSKLAAQSAAEQIQNDTERTRALDAPIVKADEQGFRIQSRMTTTGSGSAAYFKATAGSLPAATTRMGAAPFTSTRRGRSSAVRSRNIGNSRSCRTSARGM